jgi:hypothetical protein
MVAYSPMETRDQIGLLEIYEPRKPIDRDLQVGAVFETLNRIRMGRPAEDYLFEWYGTPGIGKTQLIRLLIEKCKEQKIPWSSINFAVSDMSGYLEDPTRFIQDLVTNLSQNTMVDDTELTKLIDRYRQSNPPSSPINTYYLKLPQEEHIYERPAWIEDLYHIINEFVTLIHGLVVTGIRPLVFFFDETERLDDQLAGWIEEWIITPLVDKTTKGCVVVWATRSPRRWDEPAIRRCLKSEKLHSFEEPAFIKEQWQLNYFQPNLAAQFSTNVYSFTNGHPFANAIAISRFEDNQAVDSMPVQESEFQREIFHTLIRRYAFAMLDDDLREACELMALVRWFDNTMVKNILLQVGSYHIQRWLSNDFTRLWQVLKERCPLEYETQRGYTLEKNLRYIINKYFLTCEGDTFIAVNQIAAEARQQQLKKFAFNHNFYVIEELYHLASLYHAGSPVELKETFQERLGKYSDWFKDENQLNQTLNRLKNELEGDEDIKQYIGEDFHRDLIEQVKSFLGQLK